MTRWPFGRLWYLDAGAAVPYAYCDAVLVYFLVPTR
jgi:hypothetical protein